MLENREYTKQRLQPQAQYNMHLDFLDGFITTGLRMSGLPKSTNLTQIFQPHLKLITKICLEFLTKNQGLLLCAGSSRVNGEDFWMQCNEATGGFGLRDYGYVVKGELEKACNGFNPCVFILDVDRTVYYTTQKKEKQ